METDKKSKVDFPGSVGETKGELKVKGMEIIKRGMEMAGEAGLKIGIRLQAFGNGARRNKRGLSTVETIALTVVVVGAVVGAATVLNPKLNDLIGRAFDKIAENLGL